MRAVVVERFSGLDSLLYTPEPEPKVGRVVIAITAFGIHTHALRHSTRCCEWRMVWDVLRQLRIRKSQLSASDVR